MSLKLLLPYLYVDVFPEILITLAKNKGNAFIKASRTFKRDIRDYGMLVCWLITPCLKENAPLKTKIN